MKKKVKRPKTRHAAPLIRVTPPPPKPWELNAQEVELVKQHICPGASDLELQFNLTVARRFKLDPFRQQIWFVPRKQDGEKKWIPIVGINGLLHIAARDHADFGSIAEPEYGPIIEVEWHSSRGQTFKLNVPEWARAKTTKKGMTEPTVAIVYWEEIYPNIDYSPVVREKPRHMLGKCAVAHAIRRAYPSTDGLYVSEEFAGQRPDYTREGREIVYPEHGLTYGEAQKEAIEILRSKGNWCEEHNCARSMKHLREYHFDETGTKPDEFADRLQAAPQSVPTGGQASRSQSPVQHASGPAGDSHPKKPRTTPKQSPAEPKEAPTTTIAANSKLPGKRSAPEGKSTQNGGTNVPTAPDDSSLNFKPPQARIPVKVRSVKPTKSGAGKAVELDTGKWLYCFDNRKMGEDGEVLFNILASAAGKECIFLTKQSKKTDGKEYTTITHLLQCGDREWGEDGVPILRREAATGKEREPGEDSQEEWLK